MPAQLTYPGVYIEEVPSGVHAIVGVGTSITAFIGRTRSGPVNQPVDVFSLAEFTRRFGGLWRDSSVGFAVRDFFQNGGTHAIVVRLAKDADTAELDVDALKLVAASPGSWGVDLRAAVDHDDPDPDLAAKLGVDPSKLFNLTVRLSTPGGAVEKFHNLSAADNKRNVVKILADQSQLVRVAPGWAAADPAAGKDPLSVLEDAVEAARIAYSQDAAKQAAYAQAQAALRAGVDQARAGVSDGADLTAAEFTGGTAEQDHQGLYALDQADLFNILCIPPPALDGDLPGNIASAASVYCEKRRAVFLVDPPVDWKDPSAGMAQVQAFDGAKANAAMYFPRLRQPNPLKDGLYEEFVPCGAVAGVMARTDAARGVWKAPAGLDAVLNGVPDLAYKLTDDENGELNPLGINCLRAMPAAGRVVWGARTLEGADVLASDWKYLPVRRLALYLEESLYRGTRWAVFEPNDEPLWGQLRLSVGSFMHQLYRQGAFQGSSPKDAYFVKCDGTTTTQADRDLGVVNVLVGFAPLKPAEFVVITLQQIAGQIET
jgi:phage tail sheath protein FI